MEDLVSPKYQMKLAKEVHDAIWDEYKSYREVMIYIKKWHIEEIGNWNSRWENFPIILKENSKEIDLLQTLHSMTGSDLLKVAVDLGVDTPDFIPCIPTFKNVIKSEYKTAYDTFTKAYKQVETDPSIAIGLANSALESIVKEILKDTRLQSKINGTETLYKLAVIILKEFDLTNSEHPTEIKTIGSSLLAISQQIEKIRSDKTSFHGKTSDDYLVNDSIYTYFVVNAVTTVGLFLSSYFKKKYPVQLSMPSVESTDDLPFLCTG